jgi:hypothetical protein
VDPSREIQQRFGKRTAGQEGFGSIFRKLVTGPYTRRLKHELVSVETLRTEIHGYRSNDFFPRLRAFRPSHGTVVDSDPAVGFDLQLAVRLPNGEESNRIPEIIQAFTDAGGGWSDEQLMRHAGVLRQ